MNKAEKYLDNWDNRGNELWTRGELIFFAEYVSDQENKELMDKLYDYKTYVNSCEIKIEERSSRIEELKKIIKDVIQTDSNLTDVMRTRLEQILKDNE